MMMAQYLVLYDMPTVISMPRAGVEDEAQSALQMQLMTPLQCRKKR